MEKYALHIAELIIREQRMGLDEVERRELEAWVEASPGHRKLLERLNDGSYLRGKGRREAEIDAGKACRAFARRIAQERKPLRLHRIRIIGVAAATVAASVAIFLAGYWLYSAGGMETGGEVEVAQVLPAGESKAVLVLGDGQEVRLRQEVAEVFGQGEGVVANVADGGLVYNSLEAAGEAEVWHCLRIPRNGEYTLTLSDGSKIWLNSESAVHYPVRFGKGERRIRLEGEAYLEVAADSSAPFVVEAGGALVKVLGTSFNLRAYADEGRAVTTLVEGSVRMSANGREMGLEPEEQGCADFRDGTFVKRRVDVRVYTGWKDGRFVFDGQCLEELMQTLARWYDLEVIFRSEQAKKIAFTGNLRRYDDFGQILAMLELACPAKFATEGRKVYISN